MLIEFAVANFRSIKEESRLSLVAGRDKEHQDTHVMMYTSVEGARAIPLLRSAVVYGANASGKTNLLRGLKTMHDIVLSSRELDELPVTPFVFDAECGTRPSSFEVTCVVDGVRYQYGFSATRKEVVEEWLYAWPSGRMQVWFERNGGTTSGSTSWKFGGKLMGDREVWKRATRNRALFLSTAVSLNSRQLRPLFDWFHKRLHVAGVGGWAPNFSMEYYKKNGQDAIIDFLTTADLAVSGMRILEEDITSDMLPRDLPSELKRRISEEFSGSKLVEVYLQHRPAEGTPAELDIDEESHGTQKMFALAGPWLDSLRQGNVIVFDELHDNLHPELVRFLVMRFHDPTENRHGAQLIFTTHDTSILSRDVFRRDQIWLCGRDERLETSLVPLSDFRKSRNDEDLERAYLGGRFGALPYIRRSHRQPSDSQ